MQKTIGKAMILLLTLIMVFSIPAFTTDSAYASDTAATVGSFAELEDAIDDSNITDIIINKDIKFEKELSIAEDRELTITGAGDPTLSTIDYIGSKHFSIKDNAKLYMYNLTVKGPGKDKSAELAHNGGFVYNYDAYLYLENVTLKDCYNRKEFDLYIWNSNGGAISKNGMYSEIVLKNCIVVNNRANGKGGAINCDELKMEHCTAYDNYSVQSGGVCYKDSVSTSEESYFKNCIFYNNTTENKGGVAFTSSGFGVYNCTAYNNKAGGNTGAIELTHDDCIIQNSTFINNIAGARGGAIYGGTEVFNTTIIGNQCGMDSSGGGLYAFATDTIYNTSVKGCIILGNYKGSGNTPDNLFRAGTESQNTQEDAETNLIEYNGSISDLFNTETKSGRLHPVLRNNGGATPTVLPISNTVVTNAIPVATYESWFGTGPALTLDQRGEPRPDVDNPNFVDYGAIDVHYKSPVSASFNKDIPKYISPGSTTKLIINTSPANSEFADYKWSSSNNSIATVDQNGNVKGIKEGAVKITAQNIYFPNIKAVYEIKVANKVTKMAAPIKTIYLKTKSKYTPIKVLYNGNDITSSKMTWKSSNKKVAKVNSKGKITAVKKGKATITGTTYSGKTIKFKVRVVKSSKAVKSIKISGVKKTMKKGKYATIKTKINPSKATNIKITFKSNKKGVISVDKAGRVYAKKKGTAKITIKAGGKKKIITIKVK